MLNVARKEWLEMVRDGRYRALALIILVLVGLVWVTGYIQQKQLQEERKAAVEYSRAQWLNQPDKDPHQASHTGMYIVKEPSFLGIIDNGVTPYTGSTLFIESHRKNADSVIDAANKGLISRTQYLSAAALLQIILPLVVILLSFGVFSNERETGMAHFVLSSGINPFVLLCGKIIGVISSLSLFLIPAALVGVAMLLYVGEGGSKEFWLKVSVVCLSYLAYYAIVLGICFICSIWSNRSQYSLLILLSLWFVGSFLAPRFLQEVSAIRHPLPSRNAYAEYVDKAKKELDPDPGNRIKELRKSILKKYNAQSEQELPVNFRGIMLQDGEEISNNIYDRATRWLDTIYAKQNNDNALAARIFPFLALRSLSMEFSESGLFATRYYQQSVEEYRRNWVRSLNEELARHPSGEGGPYKAGRDVWERTPPFEYSGRAAVEIWEQQNHYFYDLLAWLLIVSMLLILSGVRLKRA